MKKLLATLCLTIAVILGNGEVSESAESIDGVCLPKTKHYNLPIAGKCSASYEAGDYGTALRVLDLLECTVERSGAATFQRTVERQGGIGKLRPNRGIPALRGS